jgi:EAL domain-containing protein (putative c-di-GMP-specific phosphodiesterase class I)
VSEATLEEVGARLVDRAGSEVMAARIGDESFALVRPAGPVVPEEWAAQLAALVADPIACAPLTVRLSCHVAVVGSDLGGWAAGEADQLLRSLDDAVLLARVADPSLLVVLPRSGRRHAGKASDLADRLRAAVDHDEIVARYQPIIDLETNEIVGVEALARWDASGPELERPEQFLGLAQALGLMPAITDRILRQACTDFASGPAADLGLWVSVNLDAAESVHPETAGRIRDHLTSSGLDPSRLVIEVSERIVPDPVAIGSVRSIADLGVRIAIDDFGSGWSSIAQIRSLPLTLVKLDRSIIATDSSEGAGMLVATVSMADSLGLVVLAEGIETEGDRMLVELAGVSLGQGFLWGPAVAVGDLGAGMRR